jgi:trans-aconitate methyltransferase
MKKFIDIINEFDLNKTDKHSIHSYIDYFYQVFFQPYRDKKLNILEIGTREGDSLRLWDKAFPKSKIYGIDNNNDNLMKDVSSEKIKIIFGDAYTNSVVESLPSLDIVIDDGPHTLDSQVKCLEYYLPKLNDTGVIIIEDIQNYDYIEILKESYKKNGGKREVELYDMRDIKGRYDDIILVFRK